MPRQISTRSRSLLTVTLLAVAALLPGCYREGGNLVSDDTHVYISRSWEPKTISLVDSRTQEILWSMDVPVDQQLVLSFYDGGGKGQFTPDTMKYGLMDAGKWFGDLKHKVSVPARDSRRVDMHLREAPELPSIVSKDPRVRPAEPLPEPEPEPAPGQPGQPEKPKQPPPKGPALEVGG